MPRRAARRAAQGTPLHPCDPADRLGRIPSPLSGRKAAGVSAQPAYSLTLVASCLDVPPAGRRRGHPCTPAILRIAWGGSPAPSPAAKQPASRRSLRTRSRSSHHASTCRPRGGEGDTPSPLRAAFTAPKCGPHAGRRPQGDTRPHPLSLPLCLCKQRHSGSLVQFAQTVCYSAATRNTTVNFTLIVIRS